MHITTTTRFRLFSMPGTDTRTTTFKGANPARFLGEGNRPIKDLLTSIITQGEHSPHLGKLGLTQGTPIPTLGALLQRQAQQILRCHGILQEHRQLRPILHQIIHSTTTSQQTHTHQQHTPPRPRSQTVLNLPVHHATIQPHHTADQNQTERKTESGSSRKRETRQHGPFGPPLRHCHAGLASLGAAIPITWVLRG